MKSDNLYSQILDTKDEMKSTKKSRNLYAVSGSVCTAMSIFALSHAGQANYLAASLGTGSLLAAGATISFYKFNKKVESLNYLKRQLINLKHRYETQRLVESQSYHKRIKSKKINKTYQKTA